MIMRWASPEMQQRWLPGIIGATEHWCQGFSEPEAGSDLANLRTLAIADGDEYVVNGTKIWTSTAHLAKWGCSSCAPTPPPSQRGAKHEGITALIVDMETPGVRCNPIREITGEAMFCEVVFTDARVPARLPARRGGRRLERRHGHAHPRAGRHRRHRHRPAAELEQMIRAAREHNPDALEDPGPRDRIARMYAQVELTRLLNARALSKVLKGERSFPRPRSPSCSGATCPRRWPSSTSTCSARSASSPRAVPTRSTAATPPTTTPGSASPRSAPAPPRCRRTSSPTGPLRLPGVADAEGAREPGEVRRRRGSGFAGGRDAPPMR